MRCSRPRRWQTRGWWGRCSRPTGSRVLTAPSRGGGKGTPWSHRGRGTGPYMLDGGLAAHLSPRGALKSHFSPPVPLSLHSGDGSLTSASWKVEETLWFCILFSFFFLLLEEQCPFHLFTSQTESKLFDLSYSKVACHHLCSTSKLTAYLKENGAPPFGIEGGFGRVGCHHDFLSF